jgi:transcriptional regulator with XRE-family HTH domain
MNMTAKQFYAIRKRLGLSQAGLATILGYAGPMMVSSFERSNHQRPVPTQLALLMEAIDKGFWSKHWPAKETLLSTGRKTKEAGNDATAADTDDTADDAEAGSELDGDRSGHAERHAQGGGDSLHQHRSRTEA